MTEPTPTPWWTLRTQSTWETLPELRNFDIWAEVNGERYVIGQMFGMVETGVIISAEDNATRLITAVQSYDALVGAVDQLLKAFDTGNLEMNSPEIGGDDPEIQPHPWHEEWLHHARSALRLARGEMS